MFFWIFLCLDLSCFGCSVVCCMNCPSTAWPFSSLALPCWCLLCLGLFWYDHFLPFLGRIARTVSAIDNLHMLNLKTSQQAHLNIYIPQHNHLFYEIYIYILCLFMVGHICFFKSQPLVSCFGAYPLLLLFHGHTAWKPQPLTGISGLSFYSCFLSPLLFLCVVFLVFESFSHFSVNDPFL